MFAIDGTETIPNGWSKRMRAVHSEDTRFDIVYRMRAHQYGSRPVRFFIWKNDDEHGLGGSPLPNGLIRVFRENGKDGLGYLGEQLIRYVPVRADIEVNLGPDDLVVYETIRARTERSNFRFHHDSVVGWDEETVWTDLVRNYRDEPIRFELQRQWPGHVDYASETKTSLFDYQTTEVVLIVPAHDRMEIVATVKTRHGRNQTQDRIDLR
jgi:hypothetical protein